MKEKIEKYYKIGEVARLLGIHEDTLRNWDVHGLIIADRIGTRKDRRYTAEHIKQIKEKGLISNLARRQPTAQNYSEYSKEQLIKELQLLKKTKKFGLVWEDKKEEVAEKCKTQAPILKNIKEKNIKGNKDDQKHIFIEGDNYHSLQVLNYTHKGKIDVIYIDPPYNTGNKDFCFNDDWIDKEDSYRHSKWLSYMDKRLRLAKKLLSDKGVIFISIDSNEQANLNSLSNEIFGEQNFIGMICVVNNLKGRSDDKHLATAHEYLLIYGLNIDKSILHGIEISQEKKAEYKLKDEFGLYKKVGFRKTGKGWERSARPNMFYPIYFNEKTKEISLKQTMGSVEIYPKDRNGNEGRWRWGKETFLKEYKQNIVINKTRNNNFSIYTKMRLEVDGEERVLKPKSIWIDPKYDTGKGTSLIKQMFGKIVFDNSKPLDYIKEILNISTNKHSIILDFFAGSGTAGHAVMELNKEDGGSRKFILCTNNENNNDVDKGIAEGVCHPRIKKVMEGYKKNRDGEKVEGLGGSLEYLKTEFIDVENINNVSDKKKLKFTHEAGHTIALKENTFMELVKNKWYQVFTDGKDKHVGIYFRENLEKLPELEQNILSKKDVKLYIFSHSGSSEWKSDYDEYENVSVEDIPEPILKVYKSLNR